MCAQTRRHARIHACTRTRTRPSPIHAPPPASSSGCTCPHTPFWPKWPILLAWNPLSRVNKPVISHTPARLHIVRRSATILAQSCQDHDMNPAGGGDPTAWRWGSPPPPEPDSFFGSHFFRRVRACACVCACVRACVSACVHTSCTTLERACLRACVHAACTPCVHACAPSTSTSALSPHSLPHKNTGSVHA